MAGIGLIDEDFEPVTRFDSWLDMRCQPYIEWMDQEAGDRVTQLTGCPPTCDHGPKMLWWKNEEPEVYKRIRHSSIAHLSIFQAFLTPKMEHGPRSYVTALGWRWIDFQRLSIPA